MNTKTLARTAILIALLFPLIAKGGTKAALINSIKEDDGSMFREQTLTVNEKGVRVESLARIASMSVEDGIRFC